jgi:esterase/lipase/1-acyl-sn-glycerol-3-phosphate acyltransferase
MNRFAYRTTALLIKALSGFSRARIRLHDQHHVPASGSLIFVVNHFTRLETILLPYFLDRVTGRPVWSLADGKLFKGALGSYLDQVGAVSTENPDRDRLIVKSLITGEASWVIYPEGRMVKSKKIVDKGRYMISYGEGKHLPHTGAATLALRTEFYRQRLRRLMETNPGEAHALAERLNIQDLAPVLEGCTQIVPVNLTYYPVRAKENLLSTLAQRMREGIPERVMEELMTEGTMLLSGVDVDLRFGPPIPIRQCLSCRIISRNIASPKDFGFDDSIPARKRMRHEAVKIMLAYMDAIYNLTTVNHDHLFAGILQAMPYRRILSADLRRKVFLVAQRCVGSDGVHFHHSLETGQLHLLTDDRYGKYREFIGMAKAKGVVTETEGRLCTNRAKLLSPLDLHRARVENPIQVMANEIEPLKTIQRCLRRVAWQPAWYTRREVAASLMAGAEKEFQADYRQFHIPGESKDPSVGRPFLVRGRSRQLGVLLVHGYMAAPLEVKGLAEYLGRLGYWVYVPRVKGHGTAPEDLARRSYQEWCHSVDQGYAIISSLCRRVVVGGFSNGAGLALDLAARVGSLAGVIAVSPPLRLQDFSSRFAPAMDIWNRLLDRLHGNGVKKEFVENHPENPHINYGRNPIAGLRELERLMDRVEDQLPRITTPALVIQAARDPVVDPTGTRRIFDLLGSEDKNYILTNSERHGILLGEGADKIYRDVGDFLEHLDGA